VLILQADWHRFKSREGRLGKTPCSEAFIAWKVGNVSDQILTGLEEYGSSEQTTPYAHTRRQNGAKSNTEKLDSNNFLF
jgi:hypothetical protein